MKRKWLRFELITHKAADVQVKWSSYVLNKGQSVLKVSEVFQDFEIVTAK